VTLIEVLEDFAEWGVMSRERRCAVSEAVAALKECEADHPPEPEYLEWVAAGKPGTVLEERAALLRLLDELRGGMREPGALVSADYIQHWIEKRSGA
jgi:hypothetical protein